MDIRRTIIGAMLAIGATAIPMAGQAARYAVDIEVAPPPDRVERVPAPHQGYIWAPGYYRWDHGRHVWTGGHWIRERHGHRWVPHHWERRGDRWHFEDGRWD
jgi:hypothetical protein